MFGKATLAEAWRLGACEVRPLDKRRVERWGRPGWPCRKAASPRPKAGGGRGLGELAVQCGRLSVGGPEDILGQLDRTVSTVAFPSLTVGLPPAHTALGSSPFRVGFKL